MVTIYGKTKNYPFYRIAYRADGKRQLKNFAKYGEALKEAKEKAKQIAEAHPIVALSSPQARDAITALQMLDAFRPHGQRISLSAAVSEFIDVRKKLGDRTMREAADGFLATVASVNRMDLAAAVEEFSKAGDVQAKASEGKRPQISSKYAYNRRIQLEKFAATFSSTAVSDLTKAHIDQFFQTLDQVKTRSRNKKNAISAKSRNHYRAVIKQFLGWAVRKDYLSPTHRLAEADSLRPEFSNTAETDFYTPNEFKDLLESAKADLSRPPCVACEPSQPSSKPARFICQKKTFASSTRS